MPFYQLHIDVEFENLNQLIFETEPTLSCDVQCSGCNELIPKMLVSQDEEIESEDGKSISNYRQRCKICKNDITINVAALKPLVKAGNLKNIRYNLPMANDSSYYCKIGDILVGSEVDEDKNSKQPQNTLFGVLEIRGGELKSFDINTTFLATDNGKDMYQMGELTTDGSYDVSNDGESISVTLQQFRVQ